MMVFGCKSTNKRAKSQIYLVFFEREYENALIFTFSLFHFLHKIEVQPVLQ